MPEYFVERGLTHKDVMDKIYVKYGKQFRILSHRSVKMGGVLGLFSRDGLEYHGYVTLGRPRAMKDDQEEKEKILAMADRMTENKKDESVSASTPSSQLNDVLTEIRELKDQLKEPGTGKKLHPTLEFIKKMLNEQDFSEAYSDHIIKTASLELSLAELDNRDLVLERLNLWMYESIPVIKLRETTAKPAIYILVGPTGVGKTTTIAKLAYMLGPGNVHIKNQKVAMITIDNYRIGARKQIETYGKIMGIPVSCIESSDDLHAYIDSNRDRDVLLIDTIGKSPRDLSKLIQMKEMLNICGNQAQYFLGISSTTKDSDIREILDQFAPFKYEGIVLTKLDETIKVGNLVSILWERQKPLAYITNGQRVPQDIVLDTRRCILEMLPFYNKRQEQTLNTKAEILN